MIRIDGSGDTTLRSKIAELADQTARSMGMELVLAELKGGSGRSMVRIYLDRPGGITLEDCERFSRRMSVLLDVEDPIPFSYVLEVSSPGLDRPLTKEEDFRRFVGKPVKVRTRVAFEGRRNIQGRLMDVKEGRVVIETAPGSRFAIELKDMEKANLVPEL